ncbi:MAG TPA: glycosyltransferase family 39 protein [Solirubrobacteraceae bacterium]|jgi:4-amino-4-deoxy-L-arabinose transferase-like glycosyltransferase|nr:glycosyltransferase family 39 protein [Solirubrobacteraceae bacterium]
MSAPGRRWEWPLVAAITVAAAVLRSLALSKVSPDPFYDAAVRSMSLSFHNFFLGAFEPGGSVSIDKPPVDLWLQVASVKLFGFSSTTLKLPEVAAGTLSVPLLYAAVRRMWTPAAGIAAAVAMAVLPIEVITARSDTMDAVMMALVVLALLLLVRAVETDRTAWLLGAAAALGMAFNVKLLESLIALPGLFVFALVGLRGPVARRVLRLGLAGIVFVVVSLSWLTATLLVPSSERPWAIGSTNGSAWNAAFVFNGTERLSGHSAEPGSSVFQPGHHYPEATQKQRDAIPIVPPSATRLLTRIGPLSGQRLGLEALLALLLGLPAFALALWPRNGAETPGAEERGPDPPPQRPAPAPSEARETQEGPLARLRRRRRQRPPGPDPADPRSVAVMRRASAAGLIVWMACGLILFSHMSRLHPRYVEGFTPAVAAMLGIGIAWACSMRTLLQLGTLALSLAVTVYYSERLLYGTPATWWVVLLAALAAGTLALVGWVLRPAGGEREPPRGRLPAHLAFAGALGLALVAILAVPLGADVTAIEEHTTDAGYVGALPTEEQRLVSAYLRAHQDSAHYEVAAESATQIGSLIVQDARPIVVLTTYNGRVYTTVPKLQALVAAGKVRYAFLNSYCPKRPSPTNAACSAPAKWVRAHGRDVSRVAGLHQGKVLYLLPGAKA